MCISTVGKHGVEPVNIQWTLVRGDTSSIRVDFLENDEITHFNTTGWKYSATAYDAAGDFLDALQVTPHNGYVIITAPDSITRFWGTAYASVVAEIPFDLQVRMNNLTPKKTWTPVVGTICVVGDITPRTTL